MASQELAQARRMFEEFVAGMGPDVTLEEMRVAHDELCEQFPTPAGTTVSRVDADGVPAVWVSAAGVGDARVVVYFHGGGYMFGSAYAHRESAAALSAATDSRVLVVDYRLSPEDTYPAAYEDALTAYRWAIANGAAPTQTTLAGDSCGGALVVAVLMTLRDQGEELPAAGVCISPWVDLALTAESMETKAAVDPICSREMLANLAGAYLAGEEAKTVMASPLYGDFSSLPPLHILVGTAEVLLDDATRLAAVAQEAGVDVKLTLAPDMIHVWTRFSSFLPEGKEALREIGAFVKSHTGVLVS